MRKLYIAAVVSSALICSCGHHHDHEHEQGHDHEHEVASSENLAEGHEEGEREGEREGGGHHDHDEIFISEEKAKAAGIKSETAATGEFHSVLRTGGKILASPSDENTVSATVAGIVHLNRLYTVGTEVSSGSPLFSISTSNLEGGDVKSRAAVAYKTAKQEYERARTLVAENLITQQEFLTADANLENAKIAYEALGSGKGGNISISSPKGGYVKECSVRDGDFVEVGQPLMTVTRTRRLNLQADVPERDFAQLGSVRSAKFKTSYSDRVYDIAGLDGRLLSYGKSTATGSSFIPVTFEFNNVSGIVPGAFAEIYLITDSRSDVISVPTTALLEEQGIYSVYIIEEGHHYHKQNVTVGTSDGERVEILSGLNPGDVYASEGALKIKLASSAAITPTHTHNH